MATAGVIVRPFKLSEAVWSVSGAVLLLLLGLISPSTAWTGVAKGTEVYLFLIGMMLLAELAREEKLFDWLARHAVRFAKGSAVKLFMLIYLVGTVVTTLMSNDATVVVLTPAVVAAMRNAQIKNPLPYLFICAFIANAASFVLPISNPANLVVYGSHMPDLSTWMSRYFLPSIVAVTSTFCMLYWTQRKFLVMPISTDIQQLPLSLGGKFALIGIIGTTLVLLTASYLQWKLGLPTAMAGIVTTLVTTICIRKSPVKLARNISWSVLALVAGLFVLVEAVGNTGCIDWLRETLLDSAQVSAQKTAWISGLAVAFGSNLMNNLPAGLIVGNTVAGSDIPILVRSAILIGIDLGPNLSITGSLATILWLKELRRNGYVVTSWEFLKLGCMVMIPALLFALASLWIH